MAKLLTQNLLPTDIKGFTNTQLQALSQEIRSLIISTVEANGGHLSSNLGIVETTVALHYVYDFSSDKLIFDVGHQAYAHKILTGRLGDFSTLRLENGISGFENIFESEYDAYTTGHAGTALAAGLGYAVGRDLLHEDYSIVAVVGDGAFINGVNLEAFTANTVKPQNFLLIYNDNGMSIDKNENGLCRLIGGENGEAIAKLAELFGFGYVGVIDGNDIEKMVNTLSAVKASGKPTFLHVKTIKGKGYEQAEKHPDFYHGIGAKMNKLEDGFSTGVGKALIDIAAEDKRIVAIAAAMKGSVGLTDFAKTYPDRYIDVGIAEEYAVTLSAGLALAGARPVVCIYSTFLQRAYDEIIHDICMQNLPVIFCVNKAGFVGGNGQSHQGVFDLSYLRSIPNLTLLSPKDVEEASQMLKYALTLNSPVAIRYQSGETFFDTHKPFNGIEWERVKEGDDTIILATGGRTLQLAVNASKQAGSGVGVINARTVKPLDERTLLEIADKRLITLEENAALGGFGSAVVEFYANNRIKADVTILGVKDEFIKHGSVKSQMKENLFTVDDLVKILNNG